MRKGAEDEQNKMRSTEDLAQKGSLLKYWHHCYLLHLNGLLLFKSNQCKVLTEDH